MTAGVTWEEEVTDHPVLAHSLSRAGAKRCHQQVLKQRNPLSRGRHTEDTGGGMTLEGQWLVERAIPEQCSEKQAPAKEEEPQWLSPISCTIHGPLKGTEGIADQEGGRRGVWGEADIFPLSVWFISQHQN